MPIYTLVRVGGPRERMLGVERESADICAAETLQDAIELASPDRGNVVEMAVMTAPDVGAARLMRPTAWSRVTVHEEPCRVCGCQATWFRSRACAQCGDIRRRA